MVVIVMAALGVWVCLVSAFVDGRSEPVDDSNRKKLQ